jgi:O-antigen/teichoic acid export membrane protein
MKENGRTPTGPSWTFLRRRGGESTPGGLDQGVLPEEREPAAESGEPEGPAGRGRLGARLAALAQGKNTLALLDQVAVSGTSFLATVLVGRWCGAGELGVYSLGVSLLVTSACIQDALIGMPYTVSRHRPLVDDPREYAGCGLAHHWLLSALALVLLAATAAALSWKGTVPGLAGVTWALTAVIPFSLLRDFGRRFAFSHLHMGQALALDLAVAALQLAGLAWLASAHVLSAVTAFAALGTACALAGGVWLSVSRDSFVVRRDQVGPTLRQSWSLGKWFFGSQVTLSVQGYFVPWLLAWTVGPTAAGVYVACLTVALFANPLMLGLANALVPRAAQAFSEGGGADLRRVVFHTTLLVGAAMALYCGVLLLAGEAVLGILFPGGQYEGHGTTVAVLVLAMLTAALGMPPSNGLAAIHRPRVVFKIGLLSVLLCIVLVPCLVAGWGVTGAACGFLAGNTAGTVGRWLAFLALVPRQGKENKAEPAVSAEAQA